MLGLMQDWPLLLHRIIDHANANHGERPVVTRSIEGPIETTTYAAIHGRALRLAKRLERDGIKLGDRVATLAWNSARHLEAWYAIVGIGAIYHTVNPRLFPDQIAWIMNHAEDRVAMIDLTYGAPITRAPLRSALVANEVAVTLRPKRRRLADPQALLPRRHLVVLFLFLTRLIRDRAFRS